MPDYYFESVEGRQLSRRRLAVETDLALHCQWNTEEDNFEHFGSSADKRRFAVETADLARLCQWNTEEEEKDSETVLDYFGMSV